MLTTKPNANPAAALCSSGCAMFLSRSLTQFKHFFSRRNLAGLIFFGLCIALLLGLRAYSYLEPLTLLAYDAFEKTQRVAGASADVVVVGLKDDELGRAESNPASDALIARVLDAVQAQGPAVVMLSNQRDVPVPPGRDLLLESLRKYDNVYVAQIKDQSAWTANATEYYQAAGNFGHAGFVFKVMDIDERYRSVMTSFFSDKQSRWVETMPFLAAQSYLKRTNAAPIGADAAGVLHVGAQSYATPSASYADFGDAVEGATAHYIARAHTGGIPELGWFDVLDGKPQVTQLKGKLVVIGDNANLRMTQIKTGFGRHFFDIDENIHPSTLNAFNADQLIGLSKLGWRPMQDWPNWLEYVWMLTWSLLFAVSLYGLTSFRQMFLRTGVALTLLIACCYVLFKLNFWVPLVVPLLMLFLCFAWTARLGIYHVVLAKRASTLMHWLLDQLPEPVWVLDANGAVRVANEAFCRLAGRLPKELLYKPLSASAVKLVALQTLLDAPPDAPTETPDSTPRQFDFKNALGENCTVIAQRDLSNAREFAGFQTFIVRGILSRETHAIDTPELAGQRLRLEAYWAGAKDRLALILRIEIQPQIQVSTNDLCLAVAARVRTILSGSKSIWQIDALSLGLLLSAKKSDVATLQNTVIRAFEWPIQIKDHDHQVVISVHMGEARDAPALLA